MRATLIEAAARLLAEEGPRNLTLRRLTAEVGTSTMAIYTHFGGMDELHRAVREEGFSRLAAHLGSVDQTGDPVADLGLLGVAYYLNATTNPNLYRVMFGEHGDGTDAMVGLDTFLTLADAVGRCISARRFRAAEAADLATQIWAVGHGVVTLQLAGFLDPTQAIACFSELGQNLFIAFGDKPGRVQSSMASIQHRVANDSRFQALLG